MDIALVYIVAGMSSRFGGEIKQLAKVTENETLIEYSLNQAIPAGFTKIIFVVGNKTEQPFKEKFGLNYKGLPVEYCSQKYNPVERDKPWGTTDALCSASEVLDCPFVMCNGDNIYGENAFKILVEHIKNKNTSAAVGYRLGNSLPEIGGVNRGIFEEENNRVKSITETFDISRKNLITKRLSEENLCSMNIYALFPEIFAELKKVTAEFKEKNKGNRSVECLLPTEISNLIKKEKITMEIYSTSEKCLEITHPGDELKIAKKLKLIKK